MARVRVTNEEREYFKSSFIHWPIEGNLFDYRIDTFKAWNLLIMWPFRIGSMVRVGVQWIKIHPPLLRLTDVTPGRNVISILAYQRSCFSSREQVYFPVLTRPSAYSGTDKIPLINRLLGIQWGTEWDHSLKPPDTGIFWFSINQIWEDWDRCNLCDVIITFSYYRRTVLLAIWLITK